MAAIYEIGLFRAIAGLLLFVVFIFGAIVVTSFSGESLTKWENKKHRFLGNSKIYVRTKNCTHQSESCFDPSEFAVSYAHRILAGG